MINYHYFSNTQQKKKKRTNQTQTQRMRRTCASVKLRAASVEVLLLCSFVLFVLL